MLWSILAVSFAGGCLLRLFPRQSRILPCVRFVLSLILLVMMLSPLTALLSDFHPMDVPDAGLAALDGGSDRESYYETAVTALAREHAARSLGALIAAEIGAAAEEVTVVLTTREQLCDTGCGIAVTHVSVTLSDRVYRIAEEKIRALVERTVYCPCTVLYEETKHA